MNSRADELGRKFFSKLFLFLSLFLFTYGENGYAQAFQNAGGKNTFFAEYSLEGPDYSVNYDRVFASSEKFNYSLRAGFSVLKDQIAFPLGINVFSGKRVHHAEFSLTFTPLIVRHAIDSIGRTDTDKFLYLIPGAGYRYQKNSSGLFIRAIAGPMIILDPRSGDFWNMDPQVRFSFSLGMGYSFGK
jgi:hypothetical protein